MVNKHGDERLNGLDAHASAGVRVIYILGPGRSGSTVVERLLASAPGVKALGEIHCLWRAPLKTLTCACGAPALDCDFWADTRRRAGLDARALTRLAALEHGAIRHKRIAAAGFSQRRYALAPDVQEFLRRQDDLFAAAAETSGASVLVDSSKAAPRAWALSARPNTSIIRTSRKPLAIARSWASRKHDPGLGGAMRSVSFVGALADWARAETSGALISLTRPTRRLPLAALSSDPQSALAKAIGGDVANISWRGERAFEADPDYHSLNGNPDRFAAGVIEIRPPSPSAQPGWSNAA